MASYISPGHHKDPHTGHELETGRKDAVNFVGDEGYNQDRGMAVFVPWAYADVDPVCPGELAITALTASFAMQSVPHQRRSFPVIRSHHHGPSVTSNRRTPCVD